METTWVVVASRDIVRIFEVVGKELRLKPLMELGNPSGVLRNRDIDSDVPGRATDNRMRARHSYSTEEEPRDRLLSAFYREIFQRIDRSFSRHEFDQLVLVAEPRLLGVIRSLLSSQLRRIIKHEIQKDITNESERELQQRLQAEL